MVSANQAERLPWLGPGVGCPPRWPRSPGWGHGGWLGTLARRHSVHRPPSPGAAHAATCARDAGRLALRVPQAHVGPPRPGPVQECGGGRRGRGSPTWPCSLRAAGPGATGSFPGPASRAAGDQQGLRAPPPALLPEPGAGAWGSAAKPQAQGPGGPVPAGEPGSLADPTCRVGALGTWAEGSSRLRGRGCDPHTLAQSVGQ